MTILAVPAAATGSLLQRLIDDLILRRFSRETQRNDIRDVGRRQRARLRVQARGADRRRDWFCSQAAVELASLDGRVIGLRTSERWRSRLLRIAIPSH